MSIALYVKAKNQVCMPLATVPFLCLLGLSMGMLVSRHESIESVARDYICSQVAVLLVGFLYNLFVLKRIDQVYEELVEYHKQMEEIKNFKTKRGNRPV
jgi:hypothetical protein